MKKIVSLMFVFCIIFNIAGSAFAANDIYMQNEVLEVYDENEFDNESYDKYTITFDELPEALDVDYSQDELANYENTIVLNHNKEATEKAKDYVHSLNLSDVNLEFIEASCLNELNDLSNISNFALESYTVLVPAGALNASSNKKDVSFDKLTYYGTYANRDFYTYVYSETSGSTEYKKTSNKLEQWFKNTVDLFLCFCDAEVTVPITLVRQMMNCPSNYVPKKAAYLEYYFNVNIRTRGIYTKYTTLLPKPHTTYEQVTSGQSGKLYPFVIIHPCDSPKYKGSYNVELGYKKTVYTPYYSNKDHQLKEAYAAFSGGSKIHRKIMSYSSSYYWK